MALTRTPSGEARTRLGRYELLRELTASSVGASWLARPSGETFEVMLLKVHRHMAKSPAAVEGLLAEAQRARKLAHDNVAGVLDAGVVDGEPFIVTEFVGDTLSALVRTAGPQGLPLPVALRISLDLLEGFAAAYQHDPPLGHGEIGPWCVYAGSDGITRVGGFAVDQAIWRFGAHFVKNMERLSYAAPERVKAMSSTLGQELSVPDEQSDMFSAAVLVFELLTRHKLFSSKMEAAVVQKVLTSSIPTAASVRSDLPLSISDALKRALHRDPSERFSTFEELIVALELAGPSLIGTNEAVAEFVAATRNMTGQAGMQAPATAAPRAASPASGSLAGVQTLYSGTPKAQPTAAQEDEKSAQRKRADSRATLMFAGGDQVDASAKPAPAPRPDAASDRAVHENGASPQPPVVAPAAPASSPGTPGPAAMAASGASTAASRGRAKTLMGFGGLKSSGKEGESPFSPPVAPFGARLDGKELPVPPPPRSSSIELRDSDLDVQIDDPLAFPTKLLEVSRAAPTGTLPAQQPPTAALAPMTPLVPPTALPPMAALPPPATAARKRAPARRMVTLLGIEPPEDEDGNPSDPRIEDEITHIDPAQETEVAGREATAKPNGSPRPGLARGLGSTPRPPIVDPRAEPTVSAPPARTPAPPRVAPTASKTEDKEATDDPQRFSISDEPTHRLSDGALEIDIDGTPASPVSPITRSQGKRMLAASERLRTGGILAVAGKSFELIAPVARGGMATVWAARAAGSKGLDEMVAIKTMLPEISDDPDFESMFLDEARVAAKVRHPNVATIIELGEDQGLLYLVMEWVDGDTLGAIQRAARTTGGIPTSIIVHVAAEACAGLHEAHELKDESGHTLDLVHRDISPANVLVDASGHTKIVDFGIAKSKGRLHVTKVGAMVKGKTPYLSPEQIGGLAIDRRSDLFSMGALLYVMATGLHPFRGETDLSTIENIAIKAAAPLRSIVPDIDPDFEKLVLRLLEKDPKKRYPNALDVKAELERIAGKLASPATAADVAAFIAKVIGDKLAQRREMLKAGLEKIESGVEPPPDPMVKPPSAVDQIMAMIAETERETAKQVTPSVGEARAPASGAALPATTSIATAALAVTPKITTDPGSKAVTRAAIDAAVTSESVPPPPRTGNAKRLFALIAMGLIIGLAIVAGLELFRGGSERPSGTPTARPTSVPTSSPVASTDTAATPSASPTAQASEGPAATASESAAEPSASEAAEPSTTGTGESTQNPAVPPNVGPPRPGTPGHPPAGGGTRPPRPPPRKYNPPSI